MAPGEDFDARSLLPANEDLPASDLAVLRQLEQAHQTAPNFLRTLLETPTELAQYDVLTGIIERTILDGDDMHVVRTQDVQPILDDNKRLMSLNDGYSPSRDMKRVASIPLTVVEQWMKEGIDIFDKNCAEAIRRKLNSPDYKFLRTAPGVV